MTLHFDTSCRILGILVTHPSQVYEVAEFANAFSPPVDVRMSELPAYLQANDGRMLPMIDLAVHLFDRTTGVLVHDYGMALERLLQVVEANDEGPVLFWWNELLWQIRIASFADKPQAEAEVLAQYANIRHQALLIGQEIRRRVPGSGVLQIEASAELSQQIATLGHIIMLEDCEYLAFDCYGPIANCGGIPQNTFMQWVWNFMDQMEQTDPIGRKLFLVPGAFKDSISFPEESACVDQLNTYFGVFDEWTAVGGVGAFTWGTVVEEHNTIIGARHLAAVGPALSSHMLQRRG